MFERCFSRFEFDLPPRSALKMSEPAVRVHHVTIDGTLEGFFEGGNAALIQYLSTKSVPDCAYLKRVRGSHPALEGSRGRNTPLLSPNIARTSPEMSSRGFYRAEVGGKEGVLASNTPSTPL